MKNVRIVRSISKKDMNTIKAIKTMLKLEKNALVARMRKIDRLPVDEPIDFVIVWVDDSDEKWLQEKSNYIPKYPKGNGEERYRNWKQLKYWFRCVEKYAPWVRKIHLVTYGHYPEWLDVNNEKINIVEHKDFIPKKYLPTFSTNPIELNLHRIEGLSECFVYFNDDMYLNRSAKKEDFFSGNNPKYFCGAIPKRNYPSKQLFDYMIWNNLGLVNDYFDITKSMEKNPELWFSKYNKSARRYHKLSFIENYLYGMSFSHLASPMKKSTMEKVWSAFGDQLDETCHNKYRTPLDHQQQIFHLWDILNGTFSPVSKDHYGCLYGDVKGQMDLIRKDISEDKSLMICINDSELIEKSEFESVRSKIDSIFRENYPNKSSYEI